MSFFFCLCFPYYESSNLGAGLLVIWEIVEKRLTREEIQRTFELIVDFYDIGDLFFVDVFSPEGFSRYNLDLVVEGCCRQPVQSVGTHDFLSGDLFDLLIHT